VTIIAVVLDGIDHNKIMSFDSTIAEVERFLVSTG
jgi:hypothetical protein